MFIIIYDKTGKKYNKFVHSLVASAWLKEPKSLEYDIHHKDFNWGNWSLDNLEMLTRAEHIKRHKINPINGTETIVSHIKIN